MTVKLKKMIVGVTALFCLTAEARTEINCPVPPSQVARDVIVTTKGEASALAKIGQAQLENETKLLVNNLYEKYSNVDKIVIIQLMLSTFCEVIKDSKTLTDAEKLNRLSEINRQITSIIGPKSDSQDGPLARVKVSAVEEEGKDYGNVRFEHSGSQFFNVGYIHRRSYALQESCTGPLRHVPLRAKSWASTVPYSSLTKSMTINESSFARSVRNFLEQANAKVGNCIRSLHQYVELNFRFDDANGKTYNLYYHYTIQGNVVGQKIFVQLFLSPIHQDRWESGRIVEKQMEERRPNLILDFDDIEKTSLLRLFSYWPRV